MKFQILFYGLISLFFCSHTYASQDEKAWFVDKLLVYKQGDDLSQAYLAQNTPEFAQIQESIRPWVVRIEARHSFSTRGYMSNHGTGIVLKKGYIITSKHVFKKNIPADNQKIKVLITFPDGRIFEAKILSFGAKDWAVLKISSKDKEGNPASKSPITIKKPLKNEKAIFYGYPAQLGLNEDGKVSYFHKGDIKKKIPADKMKPMTVVSSVSDTQAMHLNPIAGFPPVAGMSGGPIFNIKGELIGLQHSITKTTEDATGKILIYRVDATSISDIIVSEKNLLFNLNKSKSDR